MDRHNLNNCEKKFVWKDSTIEGESPVNEVIVKWLVSGVLRDTRNLVGRREDHLPRLNTTQ